MDLSALLTFLRGSCVFSAKGNFPERFLNLAARADMGLWDIIRTENGLSARVIARRYRQLRPLAKKCGLTLHVTKKLGLPFRIMPYRRRAGMPLGFLFFCGTIWFLSLFVWFVQPPTVSDPELSTRIVQEMEDMGLRPGSLRSSLSGEQLSVELQLHIPELSWAGVSIMGSRVIVEVKELEKIPPAPDYSEPCNIIATRSGVILTMESASGAPQVAVGQTVAAGDMLVSGVVEYANGTVDMIHSTAVVMAQTSYTLTSHIPFEQTVEQSTGRVVTFRRLRIFGVEVPLYRNFTPEGNFRRETDHWHLTVADTELPLEITTEKWYELCSVKKVVDADTAEMMALADIEAQLAALSDIKIIDQTPWINIDDDGVTVTVDITAEENIARAEKILFE